MPEFLQWLLSSTNATDSVIITAINFLGFLALVVALMYVAAFFQGRSISFWPPTIGERPKNQSLKTAKTRQSSSHSSETTYRELGAHVTVDSTTGFQNSGVFLPKGRKVLLEPEGRIHVASDHIYNLARSIKPLLLKGLPNRPWSEAIRQRYPLPHFDENNVFYRDWFGPEGESHHSDILEECKLRKELNWGTLLAVVMPNEVSSLTDPFEALRTNGLDVGHLVHVPGKRELTADRDGWLVFIINDAVISPYSPSQDSRDYYDALRKTAEDLSGDTRHKIHLRSVPLVWYSDNVGAFRVIVRSAS